MSVRAPRIVMVTFPVTKFMTNTTKGTFIGAHSLRQRKPAWGVAGGGGGGVFKQCSSNTVYQEKP